MIQNRRRLFGTAVVALSLLVVAGSGLALAQNSGPSVLADGDDDSIAQSNVSLSEDEAIDIATAETNGTLEEVELEGEDGTPVYEAEFVTANSSETEVAVHADNGTVLETESEDEMEDENEAEEDDEMEEENETEEDDEMEDENEAEEDDEMEEETEEESITPGNVSLSEEEAIGIATAESDGTVAEVELESEDGTPAYEIELVDSNSVETEVTVHADDGTVLEVESEDESASQ